MSYYRVVFLDGYSIYLHAVNAGAALLVAVRAYGHRSTPFDVVRIYTERPENGRVYYTWKGGKR